MPKFLCKVSYTAEGAKGLLKEGGTGRRTAVEKLFQGAGGKVESFYYSMGEDDAYVICDLPDAITSLALSMTVATSGGVRLSTGPFSTASSSTRPPRSRSPTEPRASRSPVAGPRI
jgi:uncharacterized protein with GYD domain